MAEIKEDEMY